MSILKKATIGIILNAIALYGVIYLLDGVDYKGGILFFIVAGTLIGLLNTFVKPIIKALSLPFIIVTMGIALIIINILIFWLADVILPYFKFPNIDLVVDGVASYVLGGTLFGIINWIAHIFIPNKKS